MMIYDNDIGFYMANCLNMSLEVYSLWQRAGATRHFVYEQAWQIFSRNSAEDVWSCSYR